MIRSKRLFLLLFWCIAQTIQAQTLHAVFVADTKDESLATACERDLEVMHRQLAQAASAMSYRLNDQTISRDLFTTQQLAQVLDKLQVESQDVVFFYYTGHGYNLSGRQDVFPILHIQKDENQLKDNPALRDIHAILKKKNARLCITLGDCCNQISHNTRGMIGRKPAIGELTLTNDSLNAAYRKLFLETSGDVLITSSKPPQNSFAHPDSGSYYTRVFDEALELASRYNRDITWETLLKDTQHRLEQHSATKDKVSLYEIKLKGQEPVVVRELDFERMNRYLNALSDQNLSESERQALLGKLHEFFVKKARIDIYVNTTLGEVQPIEQVVKRLYLNAGKIQRINIIERLSTVAADGKHYERAAIQEIWE
ncbi:caspase family protein [Siphonobacter sp. SORGH_AS_1065]|uniref:caspase family protein n=1 Tax=Siphonobacter sp. SORGH_AS_1065 TaxID=3041795 RepID=UPI0027822DF4|nr:caspase family protein [Siphonobacter sp. SORGH_AS_1065]MDQ1089710.1 hypothetical protein [Siphonobacter sp. SORGH_AS_1065]